MGANNSLNNNGHNNLHSLHIFHIDYKYSKNNFYVKYMPDLHILSQITDILEI